MSDTTTQDFDPPDFTNPDRAQDARLHTLLYGVACEWRVCIFENLESNLSSATKWVEIQKYVEQPIEGVNNSDDVNELLKRAREGYVTGRGDIYGMQPCVMGTNGEWHIVPFYSSDIAAAHDAEGALPEAVRDAYAMHLMEIVGICPAGNAMVIVGAFDAWRLMRATPAQMVAAMLSALEGSQND